MSLRQTFQRNETGSVRESNLSGQMKGKIRMRVWKWGSAHCAPVRLLCVSDPRITLSGPPLLPYCQDDGLQWADQQVHSSPRLPSNRERPFWGLAEWGQQHSHRVHVQPGTGGLSLQHPVRGWGSAGASPSPGVVVWGAGEAWQGWGWVLGSRNLAGQGWERPVARLTLGLLKADLALLIRMPTIY